MDKLEPSTTPQTEELKLDVVDTAKLNSDNRLSDRATAIVLGSMSPIDNEPVDHSVLPVHEPLSYAAAGYR